jgi:hypothetical protein
VTKMYLVYTVEIDLVIQMLKLFCKSTGQESLPSDTDGPFTSIFIKIRFVSDLGSGNVWVLDLSWLIVGCL